MGMRPAKVFAPIFTSNKKDDVLLSFLMLKGLIEGLAKANLAYIKIKGAPPIYQSGVRYKMELSSENWLTIPYLLATGYGDCEDLAAWRAAELQAQGIKAKPDIRARIMPDGVWRAHALVRLPDGTIEDPSAKLGMPAGGTK